VRRIDMLLGIILALGIAAIIAIISAAWIEETRYGESRVRYRKVPV
jgi:hypothetical protein